VQVAVVVARESRARRAGRLQQLPLRDDGCHVEVRPPERRDYDDAEDRRQGDSGVERVMRGSDAERDDGLAER
jgi:hypothetical protein